MLRAALLAALVLAAACQNIELKQPDPPPIHREGPAWEPDLPLSVAPFDVVHVNWKERLPQPYVYLEHRGSYTEVGRQLERLAIELPAQGLQPSGPPFVLFYDDPGKVPVEDLLARACFPVNSPGHVEGPLLGDVLPGGTVVYAFVGGPYPEVPRAYPALYEYLDKFRWMENGPVREIYLVNPAGVESYDDLVCEVQLPAGMR